MKRVPGSVPDIGIGWYAVALAAYITAGYFLKSAVLNWIVGPLFPLAALYFLPRLVQTGKKATQAESAE
jgi:hypothetical protein